MVGSVWALARMLAVATSVAVSVDAAELAELVRLSESQLRTRFQLPASCDPALSATRRGPREAIEVRVSCDGDTGETALGSASPRPPGAGR